MMTWVFSLRSCFGYAMTTSTLIYVDGMPTVIFDHGPRSRWADAWRNVRAHGFTKPLEGYESIMNDACRALDARRWAEYKADVMTLEERLAAYKWRLATQDIPF